MKTGFFQEFLIKSKLKQTISVKNRFRLEQRWITTSEYGMEYSNRARYLLAFTIPVSKTDDGQVRNYVAIFNEIFVDFDRFDYWFDREAGDSGLNQNRLYAGMGHRFSSNSNLQLGMLWQHRPGVNFWRLVLGYAHNLDFRR